MPEELTIEEFRQQMIEKEKITFTMLDNQTKEIMKSEFLFKDLLDMLAHHVTTSVSNTILVQAQLPDAQAVTSSSEWEKRQCPVKRDDNGYLPKGIYQIAYDGQRTDENGNTRAKFKIYKGYDASQTTDPISAKRFMNDTPPSNVYYDEPDKMRNLALCNSSPVKCIAYNPKSFIDDKEFISDEDGVKYIPKTKTVIIKKVSRDTWFQQVCFQISLGMYHRLNGTEYSYQKRSFEAIIVAYIVCKKMGVDTACFHFDVAELPQKYTPKQFRKMLEQTLELANYIAHKAKNKLKEYNVPKSPKGAIEKREVYF